MSLNMHRVGSGPPLVLLHGVGHHWQAWQPVIDLLAPRFEVFAVDLPGFGGSAPLPAGTTPTVPALTRAVIEELRDLGVERPHVAGNSMGGAIALELALAGHAASATAFSPAGFWTDAERRFCQRSLGLLAGLPRPLRPAVLRLARTRGGRAALFAQLIAAPARLGADEAVAALENAWASPGFVPTLQAFTGYGVLCRDIPAGVPVTVGWGARDWLLPARRQAPRARRRLPGARHVLLGTGHLPFSDDPSAVARTIETTVAEGRG
jgi:pimeloyl-ACP methyl ester carboxylesterase